MATPMAHSSDPAQSRQVGAQFENFERVAAR
jgi:hypothetical protein